MIEALCPGNVEEFIRLGRLAHAESRYRDHPFSEERLRATLAVPNIYARLWQSGEASIGAMIAVIGFDFFSDVKIGFELTLYIEVGHRGGHGAISLIHDCERWCVESGAQVLRPSVSEGDTSMVAEGIYKRLGYSDFAKTFQKELRT